MTDDARVQAQDNVLSSPIAAALLLKLKEECEAQYARAEAAEAVSRRLQDAVRTVVETFQRDEAQGYRSRDRQFALDVLGAALLTGGVASRQETAPEYDDVEQELAPFLPGRAAPERKD